MRRTVEEHKGFKTVIMVMINTGVKTVRCADFCTDTAEQVADAYLTTEEDCTGRRWGTLFTGP